MKLKVNKRLLQLTLISFVSALLISGFAFKTMRIAAEPEATEEIAYFKYNMEKDSVLRDSDIDIRHTPKSLIPETAVKNMNDIEGKRLVIKAEAGDIITTGKIIERGDVRVDVTAYWTIGIDVKNISNVLGGNLKEGGDYILIYVGPENTEEIISEIKIASIVDSTGKLITQAGDGVAKTINISVKEEDIVRKIAALKEVGTFEIVDAPEGYIVKGEKLVVEEESVEDTTTKILGQ